MRMPETGPLGDTFFEASSRAMVLAPRVKSSGAGCVESVETLADHFRCLLVAFVRIPHHSSQCMHPSDRAGASDFRDFSGLSPAKENRTGSRWTLLLSRKNRKGSFS
jgi:hypothetical protein